MSLEYIVTEVTCRNQLFRVAALYRDRVLEELEAEKAESSSRVGEIVNGLVERVEKNISGAFVRLGPESRAFMPLRPGTALHGSEKIPVLITKDAHGNKQITCDERLSVTTKLAVAGSGSGKLSFSKKLPPAVKEHIRCVFEGEELSCDILFRTAAKDAGDEELLRHIRQQEKELCRIAALSAEKHVGMVLYRPRPFYRRLLEELTEKPTEILSDLTYASEELRREGYAVSDYTDRHLSLPELFKVSHELEKLMQKVVWLKSGAYLVIEETEAFVSVDINSGHCRKGKNAAETYLKINCEAAEEIARQLRLRNLSGMILVDFIKMNPPAMQEQVLEVLRQALKKDRVHAEAVDITRLGIGELVRQKMRPSLRDIMT